MMTRYSARPRAPSPPRSPTTSEEDANMSDNTYSVVQDNLSSRGAPPAPPPKTRISSSHHHHQRRRHFGDSVDPSPTGSVLSDSPSSSSVHSGAAVEELASLYQATRTGGRGGAGRKTYDAVTVEQIKAQFQKQIEAMLQSQERHTGSDQSSVDNIRKAPAPTSNTTTRNDGNRVKLQVPSPPRQQTLRSGHLQSSAEKELSGIRDLQRGKSFAEARTAVQKHIERMLGENGLNPTGGDGGGNILQGGVGVKRGAEGIIKHTMHGVSHRGAGDDDDIEPPPPMHYGVNQAIRDRNNNNDNKWRSVESLLDSEEASTASSGHNNNRSNLSSANRFRSVDNLRSSASSASSSSSSSGLRRTVVEIDIEDDEERARRIKMEKGKPWGPPATPAVGKKRLQQQTQLSEADASSTASSSASSSASTSSSSSSSLPTPDSSSRLEEPPSSKKAVSSSSPEAPKMKKESAKHKVDYLGALPISPRATNLASLQRPLKDLYFKYRALRNLGQVNLPGTLEISDTGLTVQYIRELHKGVQEIFNPFPTIAVWAAVKFVHKREVVPQSGSVHHQFAFLPLISDPENNQEKHHLYHDLDFHEVELAADTPHPPIFACVMRRTGVPKQLECHGFVCTSSEDAIIVAANLYQALLETMKRQRQDQARRQQRLARKQSKRGRGSDIAPPPAVFSDSDSTAPIRPPRRKNKKGGRDSAGSGGSTALQRRKSQRNSNRSSKGPKRATVTIDPTRRTARALARSESGRRSIRSNNSNSNFARKSTRKSSRRNAASKAATAYSTQQVPAAALANGDVYTRVAIPRSKSFMNVGSQYNLQELFRELKEKEGVESIDDVLKKVITPNGISFNEIKPVYRELLLKLAMTMSQDEIFQRSKNIIAQEKKKEEKKTKKDKKSKDSGGNESSSNTISSFFKMTFSSSSKNNSLASGGKNKNLVVKDIPLQGSSIRGETDSGVGSNSTHSDMTNRASRLPSSLAHGGTKAGRETSSTISKADISGPHTPSLDKYASSKTPVTKRRDLTASKAEDNNDDTYESCCSECGDVYESVCNVGACSCRVKEKPVREPIHFSSSSSFSSKSPTPLKFPAATEDQHPAIVKRPTVVVPSSTNGSANRIRQQQQQQDEDSEIYCDCDAASCASSEKCYCSLRGDPRESHHKHRTRVAIGEQRQQQQQQHDTATYHHHRVPNNTTIIHCGGGSGKDTIRSFSSVSSCSTCNFHTCESGSTATDTTCYSIKHQKSPPANNDHHHSSHNSDSYNSQASLLSGCESPQTAWSRNARLTRPDKGGHLHRQADQQSSCHSDYSNVSLTRRMTTAGSSAGRSNDSCASCSHYSDRGRIHDMNGLRKGNSACGSSSCSNSSSNCSHRSAPLYGGHQHGGHRSGGVRRAASKVLLLSATDKSGRVVYRGASSTSNLTTLDENAPYNGSYGHRRPSYSRPHHHSSHGHIPTASPAPPPSDVTADRASILSMKKSAEIAAVFSGARINQTTDIVDEMNSNGGGSGSDDNSSSNCGNSCCNGYNSDGGDSTDAAYATRKACPHCGNNNINSQNTPTRNDLKTTLGYFP